MLDFIPKYEYLVITVTIILTGMGLPVPEEVPVIGAGILSNSGRLDPWMALAACLVGAVAGDCVSYAIGYHFGQALLRDRHWFSRLLTVEREKKAEQLFQRHGLKMFLGARFLVGLRSPMYMTAGILRIPFRWFLLVDAISAALVVSLFFGLSFIFAASFEHLWEEFHDLEIVLTVVVVLVAAGVGGYFSWRWYTKKKVSDVSDPAPEKPSATDGDQAAANREPTENANGETKATTSGKTEASRPKSVA
ncbi:MAG TPA: DedA family protein [Pirellulales bacterium]|nr:DedA family protein [Pirellulales bacterium]